MWSVWVLLWKHSLQRKRRYIRAVFDYFTPILYFLLLHLITGRNVPDKHETIHLTEPVSLTTIQKYQHFHVLFTPNNSITNKLMDQVGPKMDLPRLNNLPTAMQAGYYPFSDGSAMQIQEFSKNLKFGHAIIIFENMESDTLPQKLKYTIRTNSDFMTSNIEPEDPFNTGHHQRFGDQYETFMSLQWAIDSSFLMLLTEGDIDEVLIQEFPYAAKQMNQNALSLMIFGSYMLPFALTLTFTFLTGRLFEEKNTGVHELVKMVGVSWEELTASHVLELVPHILIYAGVGTFIIEYDYTAPGTNGAFIFVSLALHFLTIVALALVVVYVFNLTQYLELVSMAVYLGCAVGSMFTTRVKSRALSLLCCLLPQDPFVRFWNILGTREALGGGITAFNMWSRQPTENISVAEVYLFMILQIFLLSMFAWYLSRVRPGRYGQALPWNFPFRKEYWSMQPRVEAEPEETQFVCEADQKYFEKAPAALPVGIQINDVFKSFGKEPVLHGVNLTVYRGEITVLLGHNGAGKTTLINIITGLISASSGRVLVEGKDTVKQAKEVRKLIGLCPQENIFFPNFTVLEHTMFFALLKGQSYAQARSSAYDLFDKLQITSKANGFPSALSGGMRRRAQLSCAIAGGARVLVLDEPTSGLDVETRRELWDLLLNLRGDCTVLLTTHFMEEADALGDRVAALHHGRLRCHATAMFLKRAIGTGYRLSLTTIGAPQESSITSAITAHVGNATVRDRRPNGVSYNLPAKDTPRFPTLFAALEDKRSELRIDTIGVGKSTLDEVFLELCSDDKPTYSDELDNTTTQPVHGTVSGVMLYVRQFTALLLRQVRYVLSHLATFLVVMFFVILLFWAFTSMANNDLLEPSAVEPDPAITLNLDLYSARAERRAAVNVDTDILDFLRKRFKGVQFEEVKDVAKAMLQMGKKDIQEYNKYLVGLELNETSAKVLYTTTVRHAAPVALNLLSNALCEQFSHPDSTITTVNHPLKGAFVPIQPRTPYKMAKHNEQRVLWTSGIAMVLLFYLCSFCRLPCTERVSGARHAHVQAGAPRALHWAATLAAHTAQALLVCVLPVLILAATVERDSTFNQPGFTSSLFLVLVVGVVAFLAFVYFVTTLASPSAASAVLAISAFVFTQITPNIPESKRFWYKLLSIPYVLLPPHTLSVALERVTKTAQLNAHCNLNRALCPALAMPEGHSPAKCCESPLGSEPWSYFAKDAAAWPILILACQVLGYLVLTYLSDSGALERVYERACARAAAPPPRFADTMARAEAAYVEKAIQLPKKQITDSILCHNVQKVYPGCCKRQPFFAVKGVSFSVKKGECFGLLGVNGAGKTTTFKMLTSQITPTGGDIFSNGYFASERSKYMRTFSYCPQFAGLDEFLTGRQNLALLLTLRGLQAEDVATVSNSWIEEVDLTRHADKRLGTYSGGCARRLVAAAALCQAVRTALLDEPTSGVDPLARRKMHQALLRARKHHELIIASHSLDEMEALCHRIAIMSGGELRALGSAAALKAAHAQGYSLVFKLGHAQDVTDGVSSLEEFKGKLHSHFDCELQDQHQSMLSYHVKDTLRYSELFAQLEQLREQFPSLVEDYTVTETTLEEVFLALAKEARAPPTAV